MKPQQKLTVLDTTNSGNNAIRHCIVNFASGIMRSFILLRVERCFLMPIGGYVAKRRTIYWFWISKSKKSVNPVVAIAHQLRAGPVRNEPDVYAHKDAVT